MTTRPVAWRIAGQQTVRETNVPEGESPAEWISPRWDVPADQIEILDAGTRPQLRPCTHAAGDPETCEDYACRVNRRVRDLMVDAPPATPAQRMRIRRIFGLTK